MYFLAIETQVSNKRLYCIGFDYRKNTDFKDRSIAKFIGLETKQYKEILVQLGAIIFYKECYFENKDDCEKCCNYLQELYGPIIKLAESI